MKLYTFITMLAGMLVLAGCPTVDQLCGEDRQGEYCLGPLENCVCLDAIEVNGEQWERENSQQEEFQFRLDPRNNNMLTVQASNIPDGDTTYMFRLGNDANGDGEISSDEVLLLAAPGPNGSATGAFSLAQGGRLPVTLWLELIGPGGIINKPLKMLPPNCYIQIGGGDSCRSTLTHLEQFDGEKDCYLLSETGTLELEFGISLDGVFPASPTDVDFPISAIRYLGDGTMDVPLSIISSNTMVTINPDGTTSENWVEVEVDPAGTGPGLYEICLDVAGLGAVDLFCSNKSVCTEFELADPALCE